MWFLIGIFFLCNCDRGRIRLPVRFTSRIYGSLKLNTDVIKRCRFSKILRLIELIWLTSIRKEGIGNDKNS